MRTYSNTPSAVCLHCYGDVTPFDICGFERCFCGSLRFENGDFIDGQEIYNPQEKFQQDGMKNLRKMLCKIGSI